MRNENLEPVGWVQKLSDTLKLSRGACATRDYSEEKLRTILVAKIRWLLLVVFGLYSFYAASFFYFSTYGLFITPLQLTLLLLSVVSVLIYNSILYFRYDLICRFPWVDHVQIVLDLLFVTMLIHLSGGGASWFWPVYLIVTIEASFLLNNRKSVWTIGALGGFIYGSLLFAEYADMLPPVNMPFVDADIHNDLLYIVLIWLWVSILNAAVAMISSFFMSIIRHDNHALRESEESLLSFLESAHDLIQCTSDDGRLLYVNRSWQQALGYTQEDVQNLFVKDVISRESRHRFLGDIKKVASGEPVPPLEAHFVAKDGRTVIVEGTITCSQTNNINHIWSICRDVTERKQAQEQLYHLAHHDILTGLPNRILFIDRLTQAKALAHRLNLHVGVLFLDLDRFKVINDTLGHPVGDKLLQAAAKRLSHSVREIDTIARIGGDEFVVVLVNVEGRQVVENIGHKILDVFAQPFFIDGHELFVTTSIGVCMYPDDGEDPVALVKNADIAMYQAKAQGRNNLQYYDPAMDEDSDRKLLVINSLRKALDREEFCIHYQPKIEVGSGRITAFEALLRWNHPELGMVMPKDFIPVAEESGLIVPIGEWVLKNACLHNKQWQEMGLPKLRVAVNISGYQLQQKNLKTTVTRVLAETGLEPELLELEITESVIMQDPDFAVLVLSELRDVGIHISIDDFGTGYSSLAHLKRFSVNTLKIDRSFVKDVEINSTDAAIATAIIAMGNSLNLNVIAEGVETVGQFDFLKDRACDEMQGFLFSGPVPAIDVPELMRKSADRASGRGEDDFSP